MSDFFVGEILVLALLILPLIRPFSKALKTADAIAIFPLVSLIVLIFAIIGQGLVFSLIPTILIVIICIITEFSRFVMFLRQVPNNFYTIPSILLRISELILLAGAFFAAFYLSPEREPILFKPLKARENISFIQDKNTQAFYCEPESSTHNEAIIILSPFPNDKKNSDTFNTYLLNEGYKTANISPSKKNGYKYKLKNSEQFFFVFDSLFKKNSINEKNDDETFNAALSETIRFFDKTEIFLIAESSQVPALCDYCNKNPNAFSGAFFIISEDSPLPENLKEGSYTVLSEKDLKFSESMAFFPICVFIQSKENLIGLGDIRGNDILASILLGSSRDLSRKDRISTIRTFEKWLNLRASRTIK